MERKVPFQKDNLYHLYTRGVEKRIIFLSDEDRQRFILLLYLCNLPEPVRIDDLMRSAQGEPLRKAVERQKLKNTEKGPKTLVDVLAYALMPNHFHLLVHERNESGISKFMSKVMTAYSMFFNTKNERSGPLFTRPFRSKHVDSDMYARWVFSYIHLNPLELFQQNWKQQDPRNAGQAAQFLQTYPYSSYLDYYAADRLESCILAKEMLPFDMEEMRGVSQLLEIFSTRPAESLL